MHAVRNELSKLRLVHYMQYPTQSMEAVSPLPWGGGHENVGSVWAGRQLATAEAADLPFPLPASS